MIQILIKIFLNPIILRQNFYIILIIFLRKHLIYDIEDHFDTHIGYL